MVQQNAQKSKRTIIPYIIQSAEAIVLKISLSGFLDNSTISDFSKYGLEASAWGALALSIYVTGRRIYDIKKSLNRGYRGRYQ